MSLIQITNLTFGYDGSRDNVFENVSLQMDTSWKLGLIGRNGKGKTTLLRLLCGNYSYEGTISSDREFECFPYPVQNPDEDVLTVVDSVIPDCPQWRIFKEFSAIGLDEGIPYRVFSTLSKGEQTKVLLAALFLKENGFLLIDEPTNHLDAEARDKVCEYLNRKDGFILVSHDRAFLDGCIDHVVSINRTDISVQKGNFSSWFESKQRQDLFETTENEKLKKSIKRLETSARQASAWSDQTEKSKKGERNSGLRPDRGFIGHKAAKMMNRAKSIERRKLHAAEEKSGLLKNIEAIEDLKISSLKFHSDRLVSVRDLSVSYDGRDIFSKCSFSVEQGERIAVCGKNGCGKSTLLKILCGEQIPYSGIVDMSELTVSYLPQDSSFLNGTFDEYIESEVLDRTLFLTILRKLDFARSQFDKRLEELSEGQKKKVLIAASLCRKAHLYVWDEPLNYIDVFSRIQIAELLCASYSTMIFVEHDRTFCNRVATKRIEL